MIDERDMKTLLRRLCGEISPAERRRLEARLAEEHELRAASERLEWSWNGLELPPVAALPGFSAGVMDRLASVEPVAPVWARVAAAVALVAGIALGVGIGGVPAEERLPGVLAGPAAPTLAERYLEALAELDKGVPE